MCGVMFFSGMLRKEAIIELIVSNRIYGLMLLLILVRVFLTFFYRMILYKVLFRIRIKPINIYNRSVTLLVITLIEVLLVIILFM